MNLSDYKANVCGTLRELARFCDVTENYLSQVSQGHKRLTYDLAKRLCEGSGGKLDVLSMLEENRRLVKERRARKVAA